jgi:hypothetical protein
MHSAQAPRAASARSRPASGNPLVRLQWWDSWLLASASPQRSTIFSLCLLALVIVALLVFPQTKDRPAWKTPGMVEAGRSKIVLGATR